ncbi:hypothetical protein HWV62_42414 [Athelia sp. TMB]|nr:hypothetical protein HWV62_42414 [Athelia sp. TMB]
MVDDGTISEFQPDSRHMSQTGETTQLAVSSLPPFLIQLALPQDYPLHAPPNIISIRATYSWYSRLPELQKTLLEMWNGEGVLYDWIEHIRTGSFINCDSPNKPVHSSSDDNRKLRALEQRYGKTTLQRLVVKFEEEQNDLRKMWEALLLPLWKWYRWGEPL